MTTQPLTSNTTITGKGNTASLASWATTHKHSIYQFIYTKVQDKFVADEIFSDVFMAVINIPGPQYTAESFLSNVMQLVQMRCNDVVKPSRKK